METEKDKKLQELFNDLYDTPDHLNEVIMQSIYQKVNEHAAKEANKIALIQLRWLITYYVFGIILLLSSMVYVTQYLGIHSLSWIIIFALLIPFMIDNYLTVKRL